MIIKEKDIVIPKREKDSKKGDNGVVFVIGGSEDFVGAPALSGIAALRSGADLVFVCAPKKVAWAINCLYPDLITVKLPGRFLSLRHKEKIMKLAMRADCIVLGNGAGLKDETQELFRALCVEIDKPKVIDADAIKAVTISGIKNALFTPHRAEFEILLKNSGIDESSLRSTLGDNVMLLKGPIDRIITADSEHENLTGNAGMTKGGTGDVLAGLAAGFLSQRLSLLQAAINAAYIAGKCGDKLLGQRKWYSYIASDLVDELDSICKKPGKQQVF